jgi:hypothetical protein
VDRSSKTPLELADALKCPEEIRKLIRRKQAVIGARFRHTKLDD